MPKDYEAVAAESQLHLFAREHSWTFCEDWPHIDRFEYELRVGADDDELEKVGMADGYRISQDWNVDNDLSLWDEADALDGDVVRYVEALIREVRACEETFGTAPMLTSAQRITILRHVEARKGVDSANLTQATAACLLLMDAPVFMLVDPWPMSSERRAARGKLKGRSHIPALLNLGFVRMVGSRFVWRWNHELSESLMASYSYDSLLAAKRDGSLGAILKTPISEEFYGKLPNDIVKMVDVPDPDDFSED